MAKAIILFADNDPDFLKTRAEFLEQEGYLIIPAADLTEARRKLEVGEIDLAIVDIRLVDDDDEKDISGLTLAKETARSVPKIILTGFPTYEAVREALGPDLEGLPPAVDLVAKQEGPEALLAAVRRALSVLKGKEAEVLASGTEALTEEAGVFQQDRIRANTRVWATIGAFVSLLLGAGMGIGAVVTNDPRWLWGTVLCAIFMIVGIGVGIFME